MSASIKKKSKPKSDKVATNNKQQTTNNHKQQTTNDHIFCQKFKIKYFWDQFYKIWQIWENIFWKWSSRRAELDATKQKIISFQEVTQSRKIVVKIEFTPL